MQSISYYYKLTFGILFLNGLLNCTSGESQDFFIENKTPENIDLLYISSSDHLAITDTIQLNTNTNQTLNLDLTNAKPIDGHYILIYKQKDKIVTYPFGYYTNGTSLDDLYKLLITKDSVIISQ